MEIVCTKMVNIKYWYSFDHGYLDSDGQSTADLSRGKRDKLKYGTETFNTSSFRLRKDTHAVKVELKYTGSYSLQKSFTDLDRDEKGDFFL